MSIESWEGTEALIDSYLDLTDQTGEIPSMKVLGIDLYLTIKAYWSSELEVNQLAKLDRFFQILIRMNVLNHTSSKTITHFVLSDTLNKIMSTHSHQVKASIRAALAGSGAFYLFNLLTFLIKEGLSNGVFIILFYLIGELPLLLFIFTTTLIFTYSILFILLPIYKRTTLSLSCTTFTLTGTVAAVGAFLYLLNLKAPHFKYLPTLTIVAKVILPYVIIGATSAFYAWYYFYKNDITHKNK